MEDLYQRTALLVGEEGIEKLKAARIAIVGLGGVGGYAVEVLARAGIGTFLLMDGDKVDATNKNRQVIADDGTVGQYKADAFANRIAKINADAKVYPQNVRFNEQTKDILIDFKPDFIIDAIDSAKDKAFLIVTAQKMGYNIVSAMGAGNRINGTDFKIMDIYRTQYDPFAKKMRSLLRGEGVNKLEVCAAVSPADKAFDGIVGSISYAPAFSGITLGAHVIKRLLNDGNRNCNSSK